jgi:L-rhamnose mutarotase
MELIYVFLYGIEWEDMIVFLSKEEAINYSIQYPTHRVEIFSKTETSGYRATYDYYQNGEYIQPS